MSSESATETFLCVTCGEFKPAEAFVKGDCTCKECNEAGRGSVNYDLDEDGEVVER